MARGQLCGLSDSDIVRRTEQINAAMAKIDAPFYAVCSGQKIKGGRLKEAIVWRRKGYTCNTNFPNVVRAGEAQVTKAINKMGGSLINLMRDPADETKKILNFMEKRNNDIAKRTAEKESKRTAYEAKKQAQKEKRTSGSTSQKEARAERLRLVKQKADERKAAAKAKADAKREAAKTKKSNAKANTKTKTKTGTKKVHEVAEVAVEKAVEKAIEHVEKAQEATTPAVIEHHVKKAEEAVKTVEKIEKAVEKVPEQSTSKDDATGAKIDALIALVQSKMQGK